MLLGRNRMGSVCLGNPFDWPFRLGEGGLR